MGRGAATESDLLRQLVNDATYRSVPVVFLATVDGDYLASALIREVTFRATLRGGVERDDGHWCYESNEAMAEHFGVSVDRLRRAAKKAEEAGMIERQTWYVRGVRTVHWRPTSLTWETLEDDDQTAESPLANGDTATPSGESATCTSYTGSTQGPPQDPSDAAPGDQTLFGDPVSPNGDARAHPSPADLAAAFEQFWAAYPRKVRKGTARGTWKRAVKAAGGDPAPIIAGAERYRDDPNREDPFTSHPATWLNGEGWNDPPLVPQSRKNGHTRYDAATDAAQRTKPAGVVEDL